MRYSFRQALTLLLAGLLLIPAAALAANKRKNPDKIGNRDVGRGLNLYSLEREIALGKQMAQEVQQQTKVENDPVISEYVNRIGQNLVRNSDARVPFTIKVLDAEEVNAFALPGGFFFVNTGLLLKTDNEAELAGVMAHEIAHVAARHGTRQASRAQVINLATIPLIFMGGSIGYIIRQSASLAIPMGFLSFERGFEAEADRLGLRYLYETGYDPEAFVDFFEKLQTMERKRPGTMAKVFSSHPLTASRIKAAQKNIQEMLPAKPEYVVTTSEFNEVKARLMAMHNHGRIGLQDANRPTLRRAPGSGGGPVADDTKGTDNGNTTDQEDRPTLKRR